MSDLLLREGAGSGAVAPPSAILEPAPGLHYYDPFTDTDDLDHFFINVGPAMSIASAAGIDEVWGLLQTTSGAGGAEKMFETPLRVSTPTSRPIVGVAHRFPLMGETKLISMMDGATEQVTLVRTADSKLRVDIGGVAVATGSRPLSISTRYYIVLQVIISPTVGFVRVFIDGVPDLTLTNMDTEVSGSTCDRVRLGDDGTGKPEGHYASFYMMDGEAAGFVGPILRCRVYNRWPVGPGSTTEWIPSVAPNWACVDETPPNEDTDTVEGVSSTDKDEYSTIPMAAAGETVFGLGLVNRAKGTGSFNWLTGEAIHKNDPDGDSVLNPNPNPPNGEGTYFFPTQNSWSPHVDQFCQFAGGIGNANAWISTWVKITAPPGLALNLSIKLWTRVIFTHVVQGNGLIYWRATTDQNIGMAGELPEGDLVKGLPFPEAQWSQVLWSFSVEGGPPPQPGTPPLGGGAQLVMPEFIVPESGEFWLNFAFTNMQFGDHAYVINWYDLQGLPGAGRMQGVVRLGSDIDLGVERALGPEYESAFQHFGLRPNDTRWEPLDQPEIGQQIP